MKVIILAAGCGTRLRPYTNTIPKCMVKLADKSLLHHQINVLRSAGLQDIVVVGGYYSEKIQAENIKIIVNQNFNSTNMVATLFCAEDHMIDGEDLLITYGDIIYEEKILKSLMASTAPISVSIDQDWERLWKIRMDDPLSDAETLKLKNEVYIEEIGKKPKTLKDIQGQYMGLIKIRADTIKEFRNTWKVLDKNDLYDGKDFHNMYMTSYIQKLIDNGLKVKAVFSKSGWLEIDSKSDLDLYNELHTNNELEKFITLMEG